MFQTPILFIIFSRPDTTKKVFEAIRSVKPKRLFIAADGPRPHKFGEIELCDQTRKIVSNIDWDCDVKTLFRKENLGCGRGPAEAISWFFGQVEQGIILEDDCLPSPSFFQFCEASLEYYKEDAEVMHISGNNYLPNSFLNRNKHYFTKSPLIWGWATWKRAWAHYNYQLKDLDKSIEQGLIPDHFMPFFERNDFDEIGAWDYQWAYAILKNKGLCLNPSKNLVYNVGFGPGATHTSNMPHWYKRIKLQNLKKDIIFPEKKINNRIEEVLFDQTHLLKPVGTDKYIAWLKQFIKRLLLR